MLGFAWETNVPACPTLGARMGVGGGRGCGTTDGTAAVAVVAVIGVPEGVGVVDETDADKATETGATVGIGTDEMTLDVSID